MIWLKMYTERIQRLVDEGTPQSLTYAALESRLAIEHLCYERLRINHDYISHDDIKRWWQPRNLVSTLIQEVDPSTASSLTFSMSRTPVESGVGEYTREDYEKREYVGIGKK